MTPEITISDALEKEIRRQAALADRLKLGTPETIRVEGMLDLRALARAVLAVYVDFD